MPRRSPLLALIAAPLILAACGKAAPPPATPQAVPVTVVTLQPQDVTLARELAGRAAPSLVADVRPQVDGIVQKLLFTEGGMIKAGQPLYQLDDATYRAEYASARAVLAKAQAAVVSARLLAQRTGDLVKIDAVSKQENDNAQAALLQAEAETTAAQAAVDSANVTLRYALVTSPIAGRVGRSNVTQGALVTANQTEPMAVVQRLDPIYIDVTQSAAELLALRKAVAEGKLGRIENLKVAILLEDGSRYPHAGKLAFSEVTVDPSTGSYSLRVVVPNPDGLLLPGMYVRALVGGGVRHNGLLVPQRGVSRDPKGNASAMVVDAQGKVATREVQVSNAIGSYWLVDGGLAAGDKVIVEGLQKVKNGVAVTVTEAQVAPPPPAGTEPQRYNPERSAASKSSATPAAETPAAKK